MAYKKQPEQSHEETGLTTVSENILAKNSLEAGKAAIGALAGLVVGGPAGAIVGAVTAPVITLAQDIAKKAIERRRNRLERIISDAIGLSGLDIEAALSSLSNDEGKVDEFLFLLSIASESDQALDGVFKGLVAETLRSSASQQKERLMIIGDSIRGLRAVHLHVLKVLLDAGGKLRANEMAVAAGIPEIELRSIVRGLELRGMIKDLEKRPIEWELRELGKAVALFIENSEEE